MAAIWPLRSFFHGRHLFENGHSDTAFIFKFTNLP